MDDRADVVDGYSVIFTSIREPWDLAPVLKGVAGTERVVFSRQDELATMEAAMREPMSPEAGER